MQALDERPAICPYCGEAILLLLDSGAFAESSDSQEYIEDCQVCCRPMTVMLSLDPAGNPCLSIQQEND